MVVANVAKTMKAPGRLYGNVTSLAVAPYGGKALGMTMAVAMAFEESPFFIECEGLGAVTEVLHGDDRVSFAAMLRGFDDDAVELLYPESFREGAVTQHAVLEQVHRSGETHLASKVPGSPMSETAGLVLLYVPEDVVNVNAILLYNAIPNWQEGAEIMFRRGDEVLLPLRCECIRDADNDTYQIGRLADLDLTP